MKVLNNIPLTATDNSNLQAISSDAFPTEHTEPECLAQPQDKQNNLWIPTNDISNQLQNTPRNTAKSKICINVNISSSARMSPRKSNICHQFPDELINLRKIKPKGESNFHSSRSDILTSRKPSTNTNETDDLRLLIQTNLKNPGHSPVFSDKLSKDSFSPGRESVNSPDRQSYEEKHALTPR